jgi:hypothetical protein
MIKSTLDSPAVLSKGWALAGLLRELTHIYIWRGSLGKSKLLHFLDKSKIYLGFSVLKGGVTLPGPNAVWLMAPPLGKKDSVSTKIRMKSQHAEMIQPGHMWQTNGRLVADQTRWGGSERLRSTRTVEWRAKSIIKDHPISGLKYQWLNVLGEETPLNI